MKKTLDKDERWYKVGHHIFPRNSKNKSIHSAYLKLKDIKYEVHVSTKALDDLNVVWKTSCTSVKWSEFKEFSKNHFGVRSLGNLTIDDTEMVYDLGITKIEMIARELALLKIDWWEYFIDDLRDIKRKEELKISINNYRQQQRSESSATNKLKKLIFQIYPKYTMHKFYNVCKDCHYNDTLEHLRKICIRYSSIHNHDEDEKE